MSEKPTPPLLIGTLNTEIIMPRKIKPTSYSPPDNILRRIPIAPNITMKQRRKLRLDEQETVRFQAINSELDLASNNDQHGSPNDTHSNLFPGTLQMGDYVNLHNSADAFYCSAAMLSMYAMQQKNYFCDFSIIVLPSVYNNLPEPVSYEVHRLIFSTVSTRIQDLPKPVIKIGGKVTCEGVEGVIEFVYTGRISNIEQISLEDVAHINRAGLALSIQINSYLKHHRTDFVTTSTKIYVGQVHGHEKNPDEPVLTISKSTPSGQLMLLDSIHEPSKKSRKIYKNRLRKTLPTVSSAEEQQMLLEDDLPHVSKKRLSKSNFLLHGDEIMLLNNMHDRDYSSQPSSVQRPLSKSKQALEKRLKRASETPEQKAQRREKDRIRKAEFRKRQKVLTDSLIESDMPLSNEAGSSFTILENNSVQDVSTPNINMQKSVEETSEESQSETFRLTSSTEADGTTCKDSFDIVNDSDVIKSKIYSGNNCRGEAPITSVADEVLVQRKHFDDNISEQSSMSSEIPQADDGSKDALLSAMYESNITFSNNTGSTIRPANYNVNTRVQDPFQDFSEQ